MTPLHKIQTYLNDRQVQLTKRVLAELNSRGSDAKGLEWLSTCEEDDYAEYWDE